MLRFALVAISEASCVERLFDLSRLFDFGGLTCQGHVEDMGSPLLVPEAVLVCALVQ